MPENYAVKEFDVDLKSCWQVLKRRWYVAASVFGISTVLAAFAASSQKNVYESQAKLMFESLSQASSLVGLEGGSKELTALTNLVNPLDTQVEIFESTPVAEAVIEALQLKDEEGELIEPEELLSYLSVKGIPGTDVLEISYQASDPELAATIVNTIMQAYIQNDVQLSQTAAANAKRFISAQLPQSEAAVNSAELALGQFRETYGIVDLEEESKNTVETLSELDDSITQVKAQLADTTVQANTIQQKLRLNPDQAYAVAAVSGAPGVQEAIAGLQTVQSQLAIGLTRYEEAHPQIASIRSQEQALLSLLQARVNLALGSGTVPLPANDLQAGDLEEALLAEFLSLDARARGLQQSLAELELAQGNKQSRAQTLPGLNRQERQLERKLNAAQSTYETLLESFQQAQVLENQSAGNARVVSPASVPEESISPSAKLYLLVGGLVGALLGVAAAFLADMSDRAIKSVGAGQQAYDYPILGIIPDWKKHKQAPVPIAAQSLELMPKAQVTADTRSAVSPAVSDSVPQQGAVEEAYQELIFNIEACNYDLQTIAVTSAIAAEGKSEVIASLATTLANLGESVLIIDANLRSPQQHEIWELASQDGTVQKGLSDYITEGLSLKKVVVSIEPNLHVLPAGRAPRNPLAVLRSQKMSGLLSACKKAYRYVLIDTPPLLGLADAPTLGQLSDGVLVVMRPGVVDATSIRSAKSTLRRSHQPVLGLVGNGVSDAHKAGHYFYHNQKYFDNSVFENTLQPVRNENGAVANVEKGIGEKGVEKETVGASSRS